MIKRLKNGKLKESKVKLRKLTLQKDDIVVFSFNPHQLKTSLAKVILNNIKDFFPNNKIVAIPKEVKLTLENKKDLIERIKNL